MPLYVGVLGEDRAFREELIIAMAGTLGRQLQFLGERSVDGGPTYTWVPDVLLVRGQCLSGGIEALDAWARLGERRPFLLVMGQEVSQAAIDRLREEGWQVLGQYDPPWCGEALSRRLNGVRFRHPRALQDEIIEGVARGEFRLHYQPKICAGTGRAVGLEALARWSSDEAGEIEPSRFIAAAEGNRSVIRALTLHLLDQLLVQLGEWRQRGVSLRVSLNLSSSLLADRATIEAIAARLDREMAAVRRSVLFEVTESVRIQCLETALHAMVTLGERGVGFSLDDYGTGYASLQAWYHLPFEEVKIERGFVEQVRPGSMGLKLVGMTVKLARDLRTRVVAEGVETVEQARLLVEQGCDQLQGFLYSQPLTAAELEQWLATLPDEAVTGGGGVGRAASPLKEVSDAP
ncbi:EAL domain-containing protein [Halomonas sp. 328]|uniref:EAL domain-containing protein n=1 Tax=Halomonas sp. 328 TaxID=2776704 RepID=UPI0018A7D677|nr:EAL domain-containing protein [Halomonas sp. 328]MBF8224477.1 EAL domain-containing protein [Halomonas sp. 328]